MKNAIGKAPDSPTLPFYLAEFYEYQNRTKDAILLYEVLIELDPHNVAALNNLAYQLALCGVKPPKRSSW